MMVTCNLRIDFVPADIPGQLSAVLRMISPDGVLIATDVAQPVGAGKSLFIGPVQVLAGLPVTQGPTPPPPPGLTAGQAAAQLAAQKR